MTRNPKENVALASPQPSGAIGTVGGLHDIIRQVRADFAAAHGEICKLQGLDPNTHTWPEWSSIANTLRWFDELSAAPVGPVAVSDEPAWPPEDAYCKRCGQHWEDGHHPQCETFPAALEAVSASPSLEGVGVKVLEEPGFTYYECPECGFDCIHPADYEPRSTACPLCAGDSGHDVGMSSRTSLSTDKPEGKDARPALTLAASPQAEAPRRRHPDGEVSTWMKDGVLVNRQGKRVDGDGFEAQAEAPTAEPDIGAAACAKCNDTGFFAIRASNGTYAFPGPVPDDARGYAECRCLECLANPGGFDGPTGAE